MKVPFCKPTIEREEIKAVVNVLKSGDIVMGEKTRIFESEFSNYVGGRYGVMTAGCTSALFLSLLYLELKPGDEVIVPSLTFAATAESVVNAGGTPVFCDVEKDSWTIDWEKAQKLVTKKTRAIIPVHLMGNSAFPPAHVKLKISAKKIKLIFDSAHRILPRHDVHEFPDAVHCYSFYATKNLTTGIGGMIVTNDKDFYNWAATARRHGITSGAHLGRLPWKYSVDFVGWSFVPTDIQAAIGIEQLHKMNYINRDRSHIIFKYNEAFGRSHVGLHLYPVLVKDRDKFFKHMADNGIQVSAHFQPLHKMPAFSKFRHGDMRVTNFIGAHTMSLPLFPLMKTRQVNYVIDQVNSYKELYEEKDQSWSRRSRSHLA